jgi:DNA repair exonuclease SbcCD ATPase subunit
MRISSLTIENILSVEHAHIDFPENGLVLVEGWNHDTNSANGAGKTAIFEALAWGIFNQFPRSTTVSEFVRIGSKQSRVCVAIHTQYGKIEVERSRPKGFKATLDGAILMEEEYLKLLPINYQQFVIAQYACQTGGLRFLELNDSGRKDLILELMRADGFADAKSKLDSELKDKNAEVLRMTNEISNLRAKVSAYQESLIDESACETEMQRIKESVLESSAKVSDLESQIDDEEDYRYQDTMGKLTNKLNEISVNKGRLNVYKKMLKDMTAPEESLSPDGECPCCGVDIDVVDGRFVKHDKVSLKAKADERKAAYDKRREDIVSSIKDIESKISKEQQISDALDSVRQTIKDRERDNRSVSNRIAELKAFVKQSEIRMQMMQASLDKQSIVSEKIQHISREILKLSEKLDERKARIELLQTGSMILSPLGVPAYVMDSVVQGINDRIHDIIQVVWPSSSYELLSFKENKSGKVTTKMSDSFVVDGIKRTIGSLSGGERKCLSIAIDFAILSVVSSYTGADLNPLILDEPFDHLDASNRTKIVELLQEMAKDRCIIVIDHAAEAKAMFDKSISVVKKSGITMVS